MYAKVFEKIFDSSLADHPQTRWVFMDLLVLADRDGVVDMTPEAISRRTNVPIDVIMPCLKSLSEPDPRSRSPECKGARIHLIDEHRDWGWAIVNYEKYRAYTTDDSYRESTRERVRRFREKERSKEKGKQDHKHKHTHSEMLQSVTDVTVTLRNVTSGDSLGFLSVLNAEKFITAWERWESHRCEIHHKLTPTCRIEQLRKLSKWGVDRATSAIEYSIRQGWQGIYEEQPNANSNQNNGGNSKQNPRNAGCYPSTTDYATAVRRNQEASLAGQMAQTQTSQPSNTSS